jgi:hypothetical protein
MCFKRLFWFLVALIALTLALVISVPTFGQLVRSSAASMVERLPAAVSSVVVASDPPQTSILGRPSLSASFMNTVLARVGSPANGTGQTFYRESVQTGIDDAFPFALFQHESSFGMAGAATATRNVGNIVCAHVPPCLGAFRLYPTWSAGVQALYRLLVQEYIPQHRSTLETIIPVYAPSSDGNAPLAYIAAVKSSVALWRQEVSK